MTTPERRPVTDALVAMLATATGRPAAEGRILPGADPPYAVVFPMPGGGTWGDDLVTPDEAADLLYQVTSVALRADQAMWLADAVRGAVVGRDADGSFAEALTVAGLVVADRQLTAYGGTDYEGDVVNVADTFTIRVVPA